MKASADLSAAVPRAADSHISSRMRHFPRLTPEEAARVIQHGDMVAFSGFTPAGAAKAVPRALAKYARAEHEANRDFKVRVLTGASTGPSLDDALAEAEAISWRAPYQSSPILRKQINSGDVAFVDMHLSHMPQMVLQGFLGRVDVAVVEASEVTRDGRVYLTTSIGASPTFLQAAEKVIIEVNAHQSVRLSDLADIVTPKPPPARHALDLNHPLERIGKSYVLIDPKKIVGIVETDEPDELGLMAPADSISEAIAGHVVEFIHRELTSGRLPADFLPLQSGVGNIANGVMQGIGANPEIPDFLMYSEVLQSAPFEMLLSGRLQGASTCALTLLPDQMDVLLDAAGELSSRLVLRPQEISNNAAAVRQLGVIAMNTALEVDIYGHVNSTHVSGTKMMNGIGGSGDFARNAYLSIFLCPSAVKGGRISTITPMCSHVDHNEHTVHAIVTEQGYADLRGLAPPQRAQRIIDYCAHPAYRDYLHRYYRNAGSGHISHNLSRCFELHENLRRYGWMLPELAGEEHLFKPSVQLPSP